MAQQQDQILTTFSPDTQPITWRTPGRKLTKEDLSATSALILGCTTQCCNSDCSSGPRPERPPVPE
jgi:hypothetical protein